MARQAPFGGAFAGLCFDASFSGPARGGIRTAARFPILGSPVLG